MGWFFRRKAMPIAMAADGSDLAQMADIHALSFARPWNEADIDRLLAGKGVKSFVARIEGEASAGAVGFIITRIAADEAEIISIATNPARRRKGIARELLHAAIRELQRDRIARLFLEVDEKNTPALGLYRKLGFRQVGQRKGYYGSGKDASSALVMELDLR